MHRRILASAAAAALTFGLVACGDTGGGGTVTTPPPSIDIGGGSDDGGAEASDGGGETGAGEASDGGGESPVAAPDIPAPDPAEYPGMDQNTPEGAEQAFKYYIAVMVWGYQTGEYEHLSALHTENCNACISNEASIRDYADSGTFWGPTAIEIEGTLSETSQNFDIEVGSIFYLSAHTEPSREGGTDEQVPRKEYNAIAGMKWVDESWQVDAMSLEITEAPNE